MRRLTKQEAFKGVFVAILNSLEMVKLDDDFMLRFKGGAEGLNDLANKITDIMARHTARKFFVLRCLKNMAADGLYAANYEYAEFHSVASLSCFSVAPWKVSPDIVSVFMLAVAPVFRDCLQTELRKEAVTQALNELKLMFFTQKQPIAAAKLVVLLDYLPWIIASEQHPKRKEILRPLLGDLVDFKYV